MRVARKGEDLWFVLSQDEERTHGIELGDEVTFELYGEGKALMEIAKRPSRVRSPRGR